MILDVTIYKNNGDSKVKAGASVVIENAFVIKGIKVIEGEKGLFIAMPSKPKMDKDGVVQKDGKNVYIDIAHPISSEARAQLDEAILKAYQEA